jgi:hypothetical protein
VELTEDERRALERFARSRKGSHQVAVRAQAILLAAQGINDGQIASGSAVRARRWAVGGGALGASGWMPLQS